MVIKFIKNYKNFKPGEVVKLNGMLGTKLIKSGFAKEVKKTYKIKNLYVAPIILPNRKYIIHSDGIVRHVGIFTKEMYGFAETRRDYTHVLTNKDYVTNNLDQYGFITDDLVVDETREMAFGKYFLRKMLENQWTEDSLIAEEDIRELENELNGIKIKQADDNDREI